MREPAEGEGGGAALIVDVADRGSGGHSGCADVVGDLAQSVQGIVRIVGDHSASVGPLSQQVEIVILETDRSGFGRRGLREAAHAVILEDALLHTLKYGNQIIDSIVVGNGN